MRLHRGIVGSCLAAFLPLPGYKQCSTSLCLFPSFHCVCQAAHALQRPLRWLYLIISSENTKMHFWNSFICCVRNLCGWLTLYSVSSAAFGWKTSLFCGCIGRLWPKKPDAAKAKVFCCRVMDSHFNCANSPATRYKRSCKMKPRLTLQSADLNRNIFTWFFFIFSKMQNNVRPACFGQFVNIHRKPDKPVRLRTPWSSEL